MSFLIEEGIRPLVNALNRLGFASTVYSCEGHFGPKRNDLFLPTAYVTFSVIDVKEFRRLYEQLLAMDRSLRVASLRLTYDCILGRYTLSIWPDDALQTPGKKRAIVDPVIRRLSETVLNYAEQSREAPDPEADSDEGAAFPCGESVPPCALVIPPRQPVCPFVPLLGKAPESLR